MKLAINIHLSKMQYARQHIERDWWSNNKRFKHTNINTDATEKSLLYL